MIYCTFCGISNCKKCIIKTRAYTSQNFDPNASTTSSGKDKQLRG